MTVRVLFVAELAERVGQRELELDLADGTTVGAALAALVDRYPALAAVRDRLAVAVNLAYADAHRTLIDSDELALIPPVSGG